MQEILDIQRCTPVTWNRNCGLCSTSVVLTFLVTTSGNCSSNPSACFNNKFMLTYDIKFCISLGLSKHMSIPYFVEMKKMLLIGRSVLVQRLQRCILWDVLNCALCILDYFLSFFFDIMVLHMNCCGYFPVPFLLYSS